MRRIEISKERKLFKELAKETKQVEEDEEENCTLLNLIIAITLMKAKYAISLDQAIIKSSNNNNSTDISRGQQQPTITLANFPLSLTASSHIVTNPLAFIPLNNYFI